MIFSKIIKKKLKIGAQYKMVISKPFLIMILNAIHISPEKPKDRNLGLKKKIFTFYDMERSNDSVI
jgi:hypothetical protein